MTDTTNSTKFSITFTCKYSGLKLGIFTPSVGLYNKSSTDGLSPYVRMWKEQILLHPVFSISTSSLIHRATATHALEREGKATFPMQQKQLTMLALLHSGGFIVQDIPQLPSLRVADTFFAQVLELVSWKHGIRSERLHFPKLHVWKESGFEQIPVWLKLCAEVIDDYEHSVRTMQKAAKQKAAALAIRNLRKNLYDNISLRRLWNWMEVQIPQHETNAWPEAKELFFAAEKNIQSWTHSEIDTLEQLFLEHCETGNSISYECSKRINELRKWLKLYEDTFEILIPELHSEFKGTPAPVQAHFKNKLDYLVAEAKWRLANKTAPALAPAPKRTNKISSEEL